MTLRIDLKTLAARESEQVEWKENVADPLDVVKTLVAFANDLSNLGGGYVVCGAREVKDEHGFQRLDAVGLTSARCKELEGRVLDSCLNFVSPPLHPLVEELPSDHADRRILVFAVPATPVVHTFRRKGETGSCFVRIGRETRLAQNGLMLQLLGQKGSVEPWDKRPSPSATVADLDLLALRDTLTTIGAWDDERGIDAAVSPGATLSAFSPSLCVREPLTGLVRPRNFALLLFGREPQRVHAEAHTIFSVYPGVDRADPHSLRLEIGGTVIHQARRILELLDAQAVQLTDKTDFDQPSVMRYPQRALQEAAINALVHRDYTAHHPLRIQAFLDRIDIHSPGGLPPLVREEDFRHGTAMPFWRNQGLAWFFNRLGLAQAEGQGISTILASMDHAGCAPPTFVVTSAGVSLSLPAHPRYVALRAIQDAELLFVQGRLDEASAKLAGPLSQNPSDSRAQQLLANILRAARERAT